MKFQSVVMATGLSTWMWMSAATPVTSSESVAKAPEKSLELLIRDLSDDRFRTREEASLKIWAIGDRALPALQAIAVGKDPEQAYRARELIRKIQLFITPDTDPGIIALVEKYEKSSLDEKVNIFDKLNQRRAWRQILKLYAGEAPQLQERLEQPLRNGMGVTYGVEGVAVVAARECLERGDSAAAKDFLEMAPASATGLLALADFHRSQGTLEAELKRAKTLTGLQADAWQLALHRAAGNLEAARVSATAAGETRISAAMALLSGDPIPWMELEPIHSEDDRMHKPYTDIAIRRWQGKPIREVDQYQLSLAVRSSSGAERMSGIKSLFLLGQPDLAEPGYLKSSPLEGYAYFDAMERVPEALKAMGLDSEKPDYTGWVAGQFANLSQDHEDDEDEHDISSETQKLILLAIFLESRGLQEQCYEAYLKPLAALAEKNESGFKRILGTIFNNARVRSSGAPQLARAAAIAWAGENELRWGDVLDLAFGGQNEAADIWDWMLELDPEATRTARFDGLLTLAGMGRDPHKLREKWLALAWDAVGNTPQDKRGPLLQRMLFLANLVPDAATNLRLWDMLPENERAAMRDGSHMFDLSAAGRWDEAAGLFLNQIELRAKSKLDPQPALHAYAAVCLRKAGHDSDAAAHDAMVEKLALGNDAANIASAYEYGNDTTRAAEWFARAARQCDPEDIQIFDATLELHLEKLLSQGKWKEVASISEARAQMMASVVTGSSSPIYALKLRLQSDLGRALANLKTDRAGSIALLANCHKMFPSDGVLADDFFPALRQVGLIKEHDEWFTLSWDRMSALLRQFPDCDNTSNTAAWLASRAQRNLDQAEAIEKKILALNPDQSSFLDTMAEIQFAKANRQKALEWSARAINFEPAGSDGVVLRRQHERFRTAPLPR
ncbi:MAG: hypothetical protein V4584_01200 [Verrucomicrobiota bacterium]